jgi:ATP synthase protein I
MAGDQSSQRRHEDAASGANVGWAAVSYLIAGMAIWGFVGWLVDRWLNTDGIATAIGCVLGIAGGIYLVVRKLGI